MTDRATDATRAPRRDRAALGYDASAAQIQRHEFAYRRSPDQDAAAPVRHPVVVVGAGPVGLSLAIDLAQRGQQVLLLDNDNRLSTGSRAICFAKRTLEIWDRLGVGAPMCAKGVEWNVGKVFFKDQQLYAFDLLPEPGHERPAFINLQQYYAEAYLAVRAAELPGIRDPLEQHRRVGASRRTMACCWASTRPTAATRFAPITWPPATARARRCARCSARKARGACSATAS